MSDKERLEQIFEKYSVDLNGEKVIVNKDIEWLIEQAEKAEEHQKRLLLGVEMARIHAEFLNLENEIKRLREENKRLREALQFYADDKSWEFDWLDDIRESLIWQDHGETARIALEDGKR